MFVLDVVIITHIMIIFRLQIPFAVDPMYFIAHFLSKIDIDFVNVSNILIFFFIILFDVLILRATL